MTCRLYTNDIFGGRKDNKTKRKIAIRKPTEYETVVRTSRFNIFVDPSANTTWPFLQHQNLRTAYHFPAPSRRSSSWGAPECHPTLSLLLRFLMDASAWGATEAFATRPRSYHRWVPDLSAAAVAREYRKTPRGVLTRRRVKPGLVDRFVRRCGTSETQAGQGMMQTPFLG